MRAKYLMPDDYVVHGYSLSTDSHSSALWTAYTIVFLERSRNKGSSSGICSPDSKRHEVSSPHGLIPAHTLASRNRQMCSSTAAGPRTPEHTRLVREFGHKVRSTFISTAHSHKSRTTTKRVKYANHTKVALAGLYDPNLNAGVNQFSVQRDLAV